MNFDCFNKSGSVNDSNNRRLRSFLTSSKVVANYSSIYLIRNLSKIDSSSFLAKYNILQVLLLKSS